MPFTASHKNLFRFDSTSASIEQNVYIFRSIPCWMASLLSVDRFHVSPVVTFGTLGSTLDCFMLAIAAVQVEGTSIALRGTNPLSAGLFGRACDTRKLPTT